MRGARFVTVDLPPHHQGVGQALRAAYRPDTTNIPTELMDLLQQLDRN